MADDFAALTDGTKVQTFSNNIGGNVVEVQASALVDQFGVPIGTTTNPLAFWDPDTTTSGTITATDAVVTAPAGDGTFRTGASTAGSTVFVRCPGGDAAWNTQITGLTSGTLYFEGSLDSTNGSDGQWINLNGRQTGVLNTILAGNATANGMYRGNTSGLTYFRIRSVGTLSGTPAIRINVSAGTGATFLNASIPAGTNAIGRLNHDANRQTWVGYAEAVAGSVTDALITMSTSTNAAAVVNATSYSVPAGKILRLMGINASWVSTTTTANTSRLRLRVNGSGAAIVTSPILWTARMGWPTATFVANETVMLEATFSDGYDLPAGVGVAVTHIEAAANGTLDVVLTGFLYS